jgi:hypothetical protein
MVMVVGHDPFIHFKEPVATRIGGFSQIFITLLVKKDS